MIPVPEVAKLPPTPVKRTSDQGRNTFEKISANPSLSAGNAPRLAEQVDLDMDGQRQEFGQNSEDSDACDPSSEGSDNVSPCRQLVASVANSEEQAIGGNGRRVFPDAQRRAAKQLTTSQKCKLLHALVREANPQRLPAGLQTEDALESLRSGSDISDHFTIGIAKSLRAGEISWNEANAVTSLRLMIGTYTRLMSTTR